MFTFAVPSALNVSASIFLKIDSLVFLKSFVASTVFFNDVNKPLSDLYGTILWVASSNRVKTAGIVDNSSLFDCNHPSSFGISKTPYCSLKATFFASASNSRPRSWLLDNKLVKSCSSPNLPMLSSCFTLKKALLTWNNSFPINSGSTLAAPVFVISITSPPYVLVKVSLRALEKPLAMSYSILEPSGKLSKSRNNAEAKAKAAEAPSLSPWLCKVVPRLKAFDRISISSLALTPCVGSAVVSKEAKLFFRSRSSFLFAPISFARKLTLPLLAPLELISEVLKEAITSSNCCTFMFFIASSAVPVKSPIASWTALSISILNKFKEDAPRWVASGVSINSANTFLKFSSASVLPIELPRPNSFVFLFVNLIKLCNAFSLSKFASGVSLNISFHIETKFGVPVSFPFKSINLFISVSPTTFCHKYLSFVRAVFKEVFITSNNFSPSSAIRSSPPSPFCNFSKAACKFFWAWFTFKFKSSSKVSFINWEASSTALLSPVAWRSKIPFLTSSTACVFPVIRSPSKPLPPTCKDFSKLNMAGLLALPPAVNFGTVICWEGSADLTRAARTSRVVSSKFARTSSTVSPRLSINSLKNSPISSSFFCSVFFKKVLGPPALIFLYLSLRTSKAPIDFFTNVSKKRPPVMVAVASTANLLFVSSLNSASICPTAVAPSAVAPISEAANRFVFVCASNLARSNKFSNPFVILLERLPFKLSTIKSVPNLEDFSFKKKGTAPKKIFSPKISPATSEESRPGTKSLRGPKNFSVK